MKRLHAVFDVELIGDLNPVFLVCVYIVELKKRAAFWWHRDGDMDKLHKLLARPEFTWVGFNSYRFDLPIVSAAMAGFAPADLKRISSSLIDDELMPWQVDKLYGFDLLQLDHIDLFNVAPGVQISLKRYMGRMGYRTMVDMPFHHDYDLAADQLPVVESYCYNDVGGTTELFGRLKTELALRAAMSEEYEIDLRSRSDAQIAEAIFKKRLGVKRNSGVVPAFVTYSTPDLVQTDSPVLLDLIDKFESTRFSVNRANGAPEKAEWMEEPLRLGSGTYTVGLGGLHSTHDVKFSARAGNGRCISDFDVASYYPNIILKVGLIPNFGGMKGEQFIDEYQAIYERRIAAKRAGDKQVANSLKIVLNGTFGKLGEKFSILYSPDLMIATTITGQLNLLCLIHDIEQLDDVRVISANTDGIMVDYPEWQRGAVLAMISANAQRTGFEYEETRYATVAMKDVNNYLAVTAELPAVIIEPNGEIIEQKAKKTSVKAKGLYASNRPEENPLYLMKNPTMEVCSRMARDYLVHGRLPEDSLPHYTDMRDFVAIREIKGGGIQYEGYEQLDDWVEVADREWYRQAWIDDGVTRATVKRKSRPKPVEVGVGGAPFGRVARWYMTRDFLPPLSYIQSGNKVPKTEGARVCMTLPDALPRDLDRNWYISETYTMLADMGIEVMEAAC